MKIEDLMVGDFVRVIEPDKYAGYIGEVKDIGSETRYLTLFVPYCNIDVFIEDVEGIPLTKELLEKNGFEGDREVMQYHFEEDGQRYHFSLRQMYDKEDKPSGYSFYAFSVLTILDYVHQLQHALKLCGIEKDIII